MMKLIRLEWKKNNTSKYLLSAGIITVVLSIFLFALAFLGIARDPETGVADIAEGMDSIIAPLELFTSSAFLVMTSVMLATFIVSTYRNKTMNLMFSYPIRRKKIILSQMFSVWIFNFIMLILCKLIIYGILTFSSQFMQSDFLIDFDMTQASFYLQVAFKSAVTISVSFIALFVGLAMKKSSKATIVTSFLLILLLQGNVGDINLSNNLFFPLVLIGVSFICAFLLLKDVEKKDLL